MLYPQGLPDEGLLRLTCETLVCFCGGTGESLVASSEHSWPSFLRDVQSFVGSTTELPLVVLTTANPITGLISLRRELEAAAPRLLSAQWIIFFDPDSASRFIPEARELGAVEGSLEMAPLWLTRAGDFLLLSRRVAEPQKLPERLERLESGAPSSRMVPSIGTRYSEHPSSPAHDDESLAPGQSHHTEPNVQFADTTTIGQLGSTELRAAVVGTDCSSTDDEEIPPSAVVSTNRQTPAARRTQTIAGMGPPLAPATQSPPAGPPHPNPTAASPLGRVSLVTHRIRQVRAPDGTKR